MSGYSFINHLTDRNNVYVKNGYVFVKENTKTLQGLDLNDKHKKSEEKDKVIVNAVTPVEKEIQITKSEYDIETERIKPPDTLNNKQSVKKKRRLNINYTDALS